MSQILPEGTEPVRTVGLPCTASPAKSSSSATIDPSGLGPPRAHGTHVLSVRQDKPTESKIRPVNLEQLQVLFVDDDPDVLQLVKLILTNAGALVSTAGSGQQALDLLSTVRPDVIISDISMPGFDGYQFIDHVRKLSPEDGGLTPAIALTAHSRTKDQAKALAAGFNHHLAKPMRALQLIAAISEVVDKSGRRSLPRP